MVWTHDFMVFLTTVFTKICQWSTIWAMYNSVLLLKTDWAIACGWSPFLNKGFNHLWSQFIPHTAFLFFFLLICWNWKAKSLRLGLRSEYFEISFDTTNKDFHTFVTLHLPCSAVPKRWDIRPVPPVRSGYRTATYSHLLSLRKCADIICYKETKSLLVVSKEVSKY